MHQPEARDPKAARADFGGWLRLNQPSNLCTANVFINRRLSTSLNLQKVQGLGAPVASIGDAGTFASGLVLAAYKIRVNREVIGNVVAKMIAQPIVVAIFVWLLAVGAPLGREAILICALPTAVFPTLIAPRYGVYISECTSTLILTTLAMIVMLPVAILLTGG